MIVIPEKQFMDAIDNLIEIIKENTTDENGLKISMYLDRMSFGAAILRLAGTLCYPNEMCPPYLLPEGENVAGIQAFHRCDLIKCFADQRG